MWLALAAVVVIAAGVTLVALPTGQEWTTSSPEALAELEAAMDSQMKLYSEDAERSLNRALELDPDFVIANLFSLRYVPHDDQETREARWAKVEEANTALLTPRERLFVERSRAYHEERPEDVVGLLDEYVARYPNDPYILNLKAAQAWELGRLEEAERLYQRLAEISPNWVIAYNMLGYTNMGRGRFAEAEEYFKSYRFIAPDQANPYDSLGELFITVGRYDEAQETLERALEIKPDFWASYAHLVLVMGLNGDPDGARGIVERAKEAGAPEGRVTEMDCRQRYMAMRSAEQWQEILDQAESECATEWRVGFAVLTTHFAASRLGDWESALALEVETSNMLEQYEQEGLSMEVMTLRGALLHMQGVRLAFQGGYADAESKLRAADKELTYGEASTGTYKLYNRMILAEVLLSDGKDAEAHGLLAKVRGVNPVMVADFEESGLKAIGLDRG
jgi:tetratricopeptide (TPR) repeat protein